MKKINFIMLAVILITATTLTTSCSKKEGCTDVNAENYDADAEKDDGSCQYQGDIVFWYGEQTANSLIADNAVSLTYYVNGEIVGSSAASVYYSSAPNCGQNGTITVTKDLGCVKSKSFSYSVKDQTNYEYWSGTVNFNANTCIATELTTSKKNKK